MPHIKTLRQQEFAARYHIPLGTLRGITGFGGEQHEPSDADDAPVVGGRPPLNAPDLVG